MIMITRANGSGSGSGSDKLGPNKVDICDWIEGAVSTAIIEMIPEMFRIIKTKLIALFDEWHVVVVSTGATVVSTEILVEDKKIPY